MHSVLTENIVNDKKILNIIRLKKVLEQIYQTLTNFHIYEVEKSCFNTNIQQKKYIKIITDSIPAQEQMKR